MSQNQFYQIQVNSSKIQLANKEHKTTQEGGTMKQYYLAIDIGASSGRHILGHMEDGKMVLEEIHRFPNGMREKDGHKCWDTEALFPRS